MLALQWRRPLPTSPCWGPLMDKKTITQIRFRLNGMMRSARGRDAWALGELLRAGPEGCAPIDHPGLRWSGYALKLRKLGLDIETVHERHGGTFAGRHARYVLRSATEVLEKM